MQYRSIWPAALMVGAAAWAAARTGAATPDESQGAPIPVRIEGAYQDGLSGKVCSEGQPRDVAGFAPAGDGKHPVFVYLTGTTMKFHGPDAQKLNAEMAKRGFLSVAVDYDNAGYPYCQEMMAKATCVWGGPETKSALTRICEHPRADCDRGIVVSGFSQGANLASVSKNFDPRVKGAYLMGHGHKATNIRVTPCMQDSATELTTEEMRSVNAETDFFFGRSTPQVRKQLQVVTGAKCADAYDCDQADGAGWHMVPAAALKDGKADHCYFFHEADVYCAKFDGFDPEWEKGSHPWSMAPNLDWLASRVE